MTKSKRFILISTLVLTMVLPLTASAITGGSAKHDPCKLVNWDQVANKTYSAVKWYFTPSTNTPFCSISLKGAGQYPAIKAKLGTSSFSGNAKYDPYKLVNWDQVTNKTYSAVKWYFTPSNKTTPFCSISLKK